MSVVSEAMEFVAKLMTKTPWGEVADLLPGLIKDIDLVAANFLRFLKNGCRLVIVGPKALLLSTEPFDPAKFIGQGWTVWKGLKDGDGLEGEEERDTREDALEYVDFSRVSFETCLKAGEAPIIGEEKLIRLRALVGKILLGGKTFLALWLDYQANGADSILEWLHTTFGISYVDFPGLVLRPPNGGRCVLCFCRDSAGSWDWGFRWLGSDRDAGNPSAALAE